MSDGKTILGANFSAGVWIENAEGDVLLQERARTEAEYAGLWSLPGGFQPKGVPARDVVLARLASELGTQEVKLAREPFRKDWVSDGYGASCSYSLFVPKQTYELEVFQSHNMNTVPSVRFFSRLQLIAMKQEGLLHPATAYAVQELLEESDLSPLTRRSARI